MTDPAKYDPSKPLYLVDGSGFIFRAYHALPSMNRADGTQVNAVYGFCNMLLKLLTDFDAHNIGVIFDAKSNTFRNEIYPEYKANREAPPEDLRPQFGLIRDAVRAFALPSIELEGYEADDLIAAYTRQARERDQEVIIVSSDKDLMQLVDDRVSLFDTMKNKRSGPEEVFEKFGVEPERVVDVQALAGDSTDNIPGVPGIGIKTAALLIQEYGDLETLLERAGEIKQNKRRENLIEFAEQARVSMKLVTLDKDTPVPQPLDSLIAHKPTAEQLGGFLREQNFKTLTTRVVERLTDGSVDDLPPVEEAPAQSTAQPVGSAATAKTEKLPPISECSFATISEMATLEAIIADAYDSGFLAIDTETNSLHAPTAKLVGICLAAKPTGGAYIPLQHEQVQDLLEQKDGDDIRQLPMADVIAALKPVLEDPAVLKIGHNFKYDWQLLKRQGVDVAPVDDTMLLSYVLDGSQHSHALDNLALLYLDHEMVKFESVVGKGKKQITFDQVDIPTATGYAAEDAEATLRLHRILKPRLAADRMAYVYERIERPLVPVIGAMELAGIAVDAGILRSMSEDFAKRLQVLEGEVHKLAGTEFNLGSPKQLGEVLFDNLGLPGGKKSKTGVWSTAVDVLEPLADQHEVVAKLLEWRSLSKLKSTYTDALQDDIVDGRVHTSFSMAATNTGRLSSSDPNLQNIPIRTEEGRKIRTAFVAPKGHVLIAADYSQIELRLAAHMAGIEALKDAFRNGIDIHAATASQVFDVPLDEMTPELRRRAKAINFGIIYGISAFGLAKQIQVPMGEAKAYIDAYLGRFSELTEFMEDTKEYAREHGYVETLFGRRCYVPGIQDKNPASRAFAERQAINAPLQGTAADIIKRAMMRLPGALAEAGLKTRMLLQVHDELIFEAPVDEAEQALALIRKIMSKSATLDVPLEVEANQAESWASAH
ncbi:MAG: DNA polymerase I [Alphaproteobacteria bacterium]|nr:DNA polymerase I [Alphaproteobacteria bacterium]